MTILNIIPKLEAKWYHLDMKAEETKLIKGVLQKRPVDLNKFQQVYYAKIESFVVQKIGDSRDIEEITQNTITNAIYCLPTFTGKTSLQSWIIGIAKHEVADFYRKKKIKEILFSIVPGLEGIISRALSPETALEEVDLKIKILSCLSSISEGYCHLLRLKYIENLSVAQIARKLGNVSVKSVEMKLRRARWAFIYYWHNDQSFKKVNLNFNSRELSSLAKHFGIAYAPVFDTKANIR